MQQGGRAQQSCLERARAAASRRDHLSAILHAMQAARAPVGDQRLRCRAFEMMAMSSLELDAPEVALGYAVGAHLTAFRTGDQECESKASALVEAVLTIYPYLSDPGGSCGTC